MIVNSDERNWTWMDEGLNTFCQYLAEKEWDYNYPTRRGEAQSVTDYMASDKAVLSPIYVVVGQRHRPGSQCLRQARCRVKYSARNNHGSRAIRLCF